LTPKASPAAAHRFIYRPPSNDDSLPSGLIQLPSSLRSLVGSPIGRKLLLPAVLQEPFRAKSPSRDLQAEALDDESFDSFVTRHFGSTFAHTMASALVHGIYAADSRNLSVRAAFPSLWDAEKRGNGSVVRGMLRNMITSSTPSLGRHELGSVKERMQGISVFSFQDGLEEITQALLVHLEHRPNVELFTGTRLESMDVDPDTGDFKVRTYPCFTITSVS
jgi:oxygen-dependent protoporphyrinogen oxidase